MATAAHRDPDESNALELHSGDCMTREQFHRIYESMPEDFKAELIGGTVYVASPLKIAHGEYHVDLSAVLQTYRTRTPGVQICDNATVILGEKDEVQPDLFMRIRPEYRGQSRDTTDGYVEGAPELVAEIAHSSLSIDLHGKRERYFQSGVTEYIVLCLQPKELRWFDLQNKQMIVPSSDGILRSRVFPGLWLHCEALLLQDYAQTIEALHQGLASPEHAAFVTTLATAKE